MDKLPHQLTLVNSKIIHLKEKGNILGLMGPPTPAGGTVGSLYHCSLFILLHVLFFHRFSTFHYNSLYCDAYFSKRMHGKGVYVSEKGEQWQGVFYNGAGPELVRPVLTPVTKQE